MKVIEKHDPLILEINNSDSLLVIFGGIKQGIGLPIFEFRNVLKNVVCDKVFVRDFNQAWYHKGIDSSINNLSVLESCLSDIITSHSYKRVVFLGNSMGGYAAILLGTLLNVNKVIAFSPQSFIDKINRYYYKDKRWASQLKKVYLNNKDQRKYYDLKRVLKKSKAKVLIDIFYSVNHNLDKIHSERLRKNKNVRLNPFEANNHNLVRELRDNQLLIEIIEGFFK